MEKKFMQVGHLKPGNYVLVDGHICQVKELEKSKAGKHGSSKARVTTIGVFDSQKRVFLSPSEADCEVPIVNRKKGIVVSLTGNDMQVLDDETYETLTCPKPKDVDVKQGAEVEFMQVDKEVKITRCKKD